MQIVCRLLEATVSHAFVSLSDRLSPRGRGSLKESMQFLPADIPVSLWRTAYNAELSCIVIVSNPFGGLYLL